MSRLFFYTNKIKIPIIDNPKNASAKFLFQLKRILQEEKAVDIQIEENTLSFTGGLFRMVLSSWNTVNSIDSGRVKVITEEH